MAAIAAAWYGLFAAWPDIFFRLGVDHYDGWFLDTFAILASNDAVTRGLDPYSPNPLDYFQREHVYSHWWLGLRHFGLTRTQNFWCGSAICLGFLGTALAWLRPRAWGEVAWYGVVLLSPGLLLGLDRANNDLVVFVILSVLLLWLPSPHPALAWLAAGPIAVAAGLKYYPAAAAVLMLAGNNARTAWPRFALTLGLIGLVGIDVLPDLQRMERLVPRPGGLMTFSAFHVFEAFGISDRTAFLITIVLAGTAVFGFTRMRIFAGWKIAELDRKWLGFVLGAVLLLGCFLTARNYAYRWIFAVWLAPLLWSLPRDGTAPKLARRFAGITAVLLVCVLWADSAASLFLNFLIGRVPPSAIERWSDQIFLIEQPLTWVFFWCLLGFLTHFAMQVWAHVGLPRDVARSEHALTSSSLH